VFVCVYMCTCVCVCVLCVCVCVCVSVYRPMYCSNADHDDCTEEKSRIRLGVANANGA